MKNGIYSATAGMISALERLDTASNNIANINTSGYKAEIPFEKVIRFLDKEPYPGKDQPIMAGSAINMQNGNIHSTGRKLDLAFNGKGFFTVQGPGNRRLYTRNGSFSINSKRELVTSEGFNVLDKFGKKITLYGDNFYFTPSGDLMVDNNYFTSLKVADINKRDDLEKVGNNFLAYKGNKEPEDLKTPLLSVGSLEKANVELMEEMTNLITIQRSYEFQQRALDTVLSQLLKKTITELPRPV